MRRRGRPLLLLLLLLLLLGLSQHGGGVMADSRMRATHSRRHSKHQRSQGRGTVDEEEMPPSRISTVHLIAERHSGSNFLLKALTRTLAVPVTPTLCTFKHWMQSAVRDRILSEQQPDGEPTRTNVSVEAVPTGLAMRILRYPNDGDRAAQARAALNPPQHAVNRLAKKGAWKYYSRPDKMRPICMNTSDILVIALFRNPYDWLSSMRKVPHHAPTHEHKSPEAFLRAPWLPDPFIEDHNPTEFCTTNLKRNELRPCWRWEDFRALCQQYGLSNIACNGSPPMYETVPHTNRKGFFENIVAMREYKIRDFLAVSHWAPNFEVVRYEDLLDADTLIAALRNLAKKHGIPVRTGWVEAMASNEGEQHRARSWYLQALRAANKQNPADVKLPSSMFGDPTILKLANSMMDSRVEQLLGYQVIAAHRLGLA